MRHSNLGCLVGLAVSLSPALAFGQVYNRVAPKALVEQPPATVAPLNPVMPPKPALPGQPPAVAPLPPEASPVPTEDQVVLPALKGLVFIPDLAALHKEGFARRNRHQRAGLAVAE